MVLPKKDLEDFLEYLGKLNYNIKKNLKISWTNSNHKK